MHESENIDEIYALWSEFYQPITGSLLCFAPWDSGTHTWAAATATTPPGPCKELANATGQAWRIPNIAELCYLYMSKNYNERKVLGMGVDSYNRENYMTITTRNSTYTWAWMYDYLPTYMLKSTSITLRCVKSIKEGDDEVEE
ncbi:MAG: hypothetical protein LBV57_04285 [Candidatus Symbiothrix sp.]|jgi:hypothetical protein|nr:hypothetical protein [Candidatus Symbiothrix sp.]